VDEVEAAQRKLNGEDEAKGSNEILCEQIESEKLQARATQKEIDQAGRDKRDAESSTLQAETEARNFRSDAQEADLHIQKTEIRIEQVERDSIGT
jgi:hypothetical protein